jgi:hypothetical protein
MYNYLAYVSRQSHILGEEDISALLQKCRTNNAQQDITGMLIYFDGTFVQYLEGPEATLNQLYTKISKDKRHQDVILLLDGKTDKREFADWSMAYKRVNASDLKNVEGLKNFKKEDLFKGKDPNTEHPGLVMIKAFVSGLHI